MNLSVDEESVTPAVGTTELVLNRWFDRSEVQRQRHDADNDLLKFWAGIQDLFEHSCLAYHNAFELQVPFSLL